MSTFLHILPVMAACSALLAISGHDLRVTERKLDFAYESGNVRAVLSVIIAWRRL